MPESAAVYDHQPVYDLSLVLLNRGHMLVTLFSFLFRVKVQFAEFVQITATH